MINSVIPINNFHILLFGIWNIVFITNISIFWSLSFNNNILYIFICILHFLIISYIQAGLVTFHINIPVCFSLQFTLHLVKLLLETFNELLFIFNSVNYFCELFFGLLSKLLIETIGLCFHC